MTRRCSIEGCDYDESFEDDNHPRNLQLTELLEAGKEQEAEDFVNNKYGWFKLTGQESFDPLCLRRRLFVEFWEQYYRDNSQTDF